MKKIFLSLLMVLAVVASASARDEILRDASQLPAAAQTSLKNNFKAEVSLIKVDREFGRIDEYEVILTDGSEITFDRSGNWKEVEVRGKSAVPDAYIPAALKTYLKANHKNLRVVGIERKRHGYEVTLSNGIEIITDSSGNFQRYDD